MRGHEHLPTCITGKWSVTEFRDSLVAALKTDRSATELRMYFYAVTSSGWAQIREAALKWKHAGDDRKVGLFVGTDHAITDPSAVRQIHEDGVEVRLMVKYQGVFHPKVMWLLGKNEHRVWVGSNNLTRDGLINNVEFAVLVKSRRVPTKLRQWARSVATGSVLLTDDLLESYESQREDFEMRRARARTTTFTWDRKSEPKGTAAAGPIKAGSLIVEVMPKETGTNGKQLQLPVAAASAFFGLRGAGSTKTISLRARSESLARTLTMTVFRNNTVRLSLSSLEYGDRPCVIVFERGRNNRFHYDIVPQSIFPSRYRSLLAQCGNQTRSGSRRWGMAKEGIL